MSTFKSSVFSSSADNAFSSAGGAIMRDAGDVVVATGTTRATGAIMNVTARGDALDAGAEVVDGCLGAHVRFSPLLSGLFSSSLEW